MNDTISRKEVLQFLEDMKVVAPNHDIISETAMTVIECVRRFVTGMPSVDSISSYGKRREESSMDIQKEYAKAVLKNSVATNADRIRSMMDEELADFLWGIGNNPATGTTYVSGKPIFTNPDGYKGWLEWLKMSLGTDNSNRCVCCGAIIPEGRMVCPVCERRADE